MKTVRFVKLTSVCPIPAVNSLIKNDCISGAPVPANENQGVRELSARSVADWVAEIKGVFAQGRSSTLDLARVVYAAKCKLLFGQ